MKDEPRIIELVTDTYEKIIPEGDIETCLKVLRTIRNSYLNPESFSADKSLILSHAHATIVDLCVIHNKEQHASNQTTETVGKEAYNPDQDR
jgi:hypothetical protein